METTWQGEVVQLFITHEKSAPMRVVNSVEAVQDRGLEGDRYYLGTGAFSRWPASYRQVSLIAEEALAAITEDTGLVLTVAQSRRNILTRGVPLNELVKQEFWVSGVKLRGIRLCQPCKYLARLTDLPNLVPALVNRGGLRAEILEGGPIHIGDVVRPGYTERVARGFAALSGGS